MKQRFLSASVVLCALTAVGQTSLPVEDEATIAESINGRGIITIIQPDGINKRLNKQLTTAKFGEEDVKLPTSEADPQESLSENITATPETGSYKTAGYRVQVFSDNNVKTAKSEARAKAQTIASRLPKYRTYVAYNSPYWRLRVGDFPTLSEAENAAEEIKKIFPAFASEVRVVKDRINRQ